MEFSFATTYDLRKSGSDQEFLLPLGLLVKGQFRQQDIESFSLVSGYKLFN
jgi:hypothetical protein